MSRRPPRPTELPSDPKARLRVRIEYAVSEFGALGGTEDEAARFLMRASALCTLMQAGDGAEEAFVEAARTALREELAALRGSASSSGSS